MNVRDERQGYPEGTPLTAAASNGYLKFMEVLIQHGANVDAFHTHVGEFTALSLVCHRTDSLPAVALLLKAGADPNLQTWGRTPLVTASAHGYMGHAKLLLEAGADIHARKTGPHNRTALEFASAPEMRDFLQHEINRRTAAALSIMPLIWPMEIRETILRLIRER